MSYTRKHEKENVKSFGEVFTPEELCRKMINMIPLEKLLDNNLKILDPAVGSGNFLDTIIKIRMEHGMSREEAKKNLYGCDIQQRLIDECKERFK